LSMAASNAPNTQNALDSITNTVPQRIAMVKSMLRDPDADPHMSYCSIVFVKTPRPLQAD